MVSEEEMNRIMNFALRIGARLISEDIDITDNAVASPVTTIIALNMVASGCKPEILAELLTFLEAQEINELTSRSQTLMSLLELGTATPVPSEQYEPSSNDIDSLPSPTPECKDDPPPIPTLTPVLQPEEDSPALFLEHAVWVDSRSHSLKPSFVEITTSIYKALVKNFDFLSEGADVIKEANSWAEKVTYGRIDTILYPSEQLSMPLCVTSVTCFSSAWDVPFERCYNEFCLVTGQTMTVPFMTKINEPFFFRSLNSFKVIRLPYRPNGPTVKSYSMYIFLPHTIDGLSDLLRKAVETSLSAQRPDNLGLRKERLSRVSVPNFKLMQTNCSYFKEECLVFHTEFLRVDEEGSVLVEPKECYFVGDEDESMAVESGAEFVADHPFMFTIVQDVSMLTVFVGAVRDPRDQ